MSMDDPKPGTPDAGAEVTPPKPEAAPPEALSGADAPPVPLWLPAEKQGAIAATLAGEAPPVAGPAARGTDPFADDGQRSGGRVDDGSGRGSDPLRDTLLQLGYLSEEHSARVAEHQQKRGLDFDQAALELGYITPDDLDRAREQLITSLAQRGVKRRAVAEEIIVLSDPRGVRAEAVRLLRTQVIAQHIKAGRRGLAFVAPIDDSGCSNVIANLAVALAQVGIKTLLVDANMRSPRQHEIFGLDAEAPGLSSFLSLAVARPERVVNANVLPSLAIITAGPPVPRPQELLSTRRFRDGVNMLLREYDIVLFDTPPANSSADALTIGAAAGYVLIVGRRDHTFFKDVSTLVDQLQTSRCPVIGSVLNEF
jgi:capsular exopolysaccharide synthesis family protein